MSVYSTQSMAIIAEIDYYNRMLLTRNSFSLFKIELDADGKPIYKQFAVALEEPCGLSFDFSNFSSLQRIYVNKIWLNQGREGQERSYSYQALTIDTETFDQAIEISKPCDFF